jgi:hypothetical protein
MAFRTSVLVGALALAAATASARAQVLYPATPYYPPPPYAYYPVPAPPPSWSYDPYTSGLGPCTQRFPGDPPCSQTVYPSYGQPSYWSR